VRSSGVMSQLASSKRSFWPKRFPAEESWSIPLLFSHCAALLTMLVAEWPEAEAVRYTLTSRGEPSGANRGQNLVK
jgi:hypothetical protein